MGEKKKRRFVNIAQSVDGGGAKEMIQSGRTSREESLGKKRYTRTGLAYLSGDNDMVMDEVSRVREDSTQQVYMR